MSLADALAQLNTESGSNDGDTIENPYNKLAHRALQVNKKNPKYLVRILPPVGENSIFAEYRRWFTQYQSKSGQKTTAMTLSAKQDPEDPLEAYIQNMDAAGKLINSFGGKNWPSRRYLFNVVPYRINANHQLEMVTTPDGLPDVYVMDLNKNQTQELIQSLSDELNNPNLNPNVTAQMGVQPTQEQIDYSFASSALAYPVYLIRQNTSPVSFTQQILTQYPLAPLPQGWETKLEDLQALTLPSYKQNRSFVDYVINQGNGLLAQQPSTTPAVDDVPWTNAEIDAVLPGNMTQQAPVADVHTVQMPPSAPVAPAQPVRPAPVQPVAPNPVASVAPVAPQTPVSPLAGLGNTIASQAPKTAPAAPQPSAQPAPAQPSQQAPVAPDNLNDSLDDIMKDAGLDGLNINL